MSFVNITETDRVSSQSKVRQLVDVVQSDIANVDSDGIITNTRRKYEVFVTGGLNLQGVSSSLFQTVYDQDFTLQTSNAMLDMTVGLWHSGSTVQDCKTGEDTSGKLLFPSQSLMMREKVGIYRQYAQNLLGDANDAFHSPYGSSETADRIDEAVFLNFRRLFVRDNIAKGTFAMRLNTTASLHTGDGGTDSTNLYVVPTGSEIFSTVGALNEQIVSPVAGEVGTIKRDATSEPSGLIFYDSGIVVLDAKKVFKADQPLSGTISSINPTAYADVLAGQELLDAPFIPNLWQSGSIDDIVDHIAGTRFLSGSATSTAYQNETFINSSLIFCRAAPSQLNYSTNPTYVDAAGKIRVVDGATDQPFSYVTTIGLYNADGELLAVAKTSRPIEKNPETDLSIRVRLDY